MATQTQNLELFKQDGVEYPSLNMLNINMDKIDEAIGAIGNKGSLQDQIDALGESVSKFNVSSWISQVEFAAGNTKTLTLSQGSGGPEARLMFGSSGIRVEYRPTPNDTWQAKNSFF